MGEVWLAKHTSLGGEFAIKLADPREQDGDESASGRFQLEAQLSAKFSRKTRHVVSVSDHGEEEDGVAYLVMELLDGQSLDARLERTGPLDLTEVSAIVGQIARALAVAHAEETFHRDLKPANVFLTRDEDGQLLVKVFDFGIARTRKPFQVNSPFATSKDMVLGTPSYMSPEQARGHKTLDHRCDVWALAVLAYEALTGSIPWEGDTVEEIFLAVCTFKAVPILQKRPSLPPGAKVLFEKAFASKIDDRFATAIDFALALRALCTPEALEAAGVGAVAEKRLRMRPTEPSLPSLDGIDGAGSDDSPSVPPGIVMHETMVEGLPKKNKTPLVAALLLLLMLGGVVTVFVVRGLHGSTSEEPAPVVGASQKEETKEEPKDEPRDPSVVSVTSAPSSSPTPKLAQPEIEPSNRARESAVPHTVSVKSPVGAKSSSSSAGPSPNAATTPKKPDGTAHPAASTRAPGDKSNVF